MYGSMLLYCFLGVAIVAEVFMAAIERITSTEREVMMTLRGKEKPFAIRVWNPTIANLTLMALGSSAPEILLSVIELFGNRMYSGALGPSTIVGSAAFNLLMIISVCVISIPAGETRKVKEVGVYICTGIASVLAYIWLIVMLEVYSPEVVEPWEGISTFVAFPILVLLAYLIDIGYFNPAVAKKHWTQAMISSHLLAPKAGGAELMDATTLSFQQQKAEAAMHPEVLAALISEVEKELDGASIDAATLAELVAAKLEASVPKSRAFYRIQATKQFTGEKKLPGFGAGFAGAASKILSSGKRALGGGYTRLVNSVEDGQATSSSKKASSASEPATLSVACDHYVFMESCTVASIRIVRTGNTRCTATVKYATMGGTAQPGSDYTNVSGTLTFKPGVTTQVVEVPIINDDHVEPDEHFTFVLSAPGGLEEPKKGNGSPSSTEKKPTAGPGARIAILGEQSSCRVTIIDDDVAGMLRFSTHSVTVVESGSAVEVEVERVNGSSGIVSCSYHTEDGQAIAAADYVPTSGTLTYNHGEARKLIKVPLIDDGHYEKDERFKIVLSHPKGGATFDSGAATEVCEVAIKSDDKKRLRVDEIAKIISMPPKATAFEAAPTTWADQFRDALLVNGGDEDAENGPPTLSDYALHALSLPWKLFFAFIPPNAIADGLVAFVVSLVFIGIVTAVIGDIAGLFGCVLGLPDAITAITFVAMGTSLPDTFASMSAASSDATADAAIVNVTGSNAVNVLLGLGLPWMVGALYWSSVGATAEWVAAYPDLAELYPNGGFVVRSGDLVYSVTVFCTCAVLCLGTLSLRRICVGYELGGPLLPKLCIGGFFACLWVVYIAASVKSILGGAA